MILDKNMCFLRKTAASELRPALPTFSSRISRTTSASSNKTMTFHNVRYCNSFGELCLKMNDTSLCVRNFGLGWYTAKIMIAPYLGCAFATIMRRQDHQIIAAAMTLSINTLTMSHPLRGRRYWVSPRHP
jgi:hypothetical protein